MNNTRKEFIALRDSGYYNKGRIKQCVNCGRVDDLELHHIVPLALNGTNKYSNVIYLCECCHGKIHGLKRKGHSKLTREGIQTARLNGKQIGQRRGAKLVTKKSIEAKKQIIKYNKAFDGTLNNEETWRLINISKMTFYKYKKEIEAEQGQS